MKRRMKKLPAAALTLCLILITTVNVFAAPVTMEDAIQTALEDAGIQKSGTVGLKAEKDGRTYEIEFVNAVTGDEYDYEIFEKNGKIKEADVDYAHEYSRSGNKVGKAKAIASAAMAAGVKTRTVKRGTCRYKTDDGEWIYKLTFKTKKCRYKIEVQAATGKVIEMSRKYN